MIVNFVNSQILKHHSKNLLISQISYLRQYWTYLSPERRRGFVDSIVLTQFQDFNNWLLKEGK